MLELARLWRQSNYRPAHHSFCAWDGEEQGLLGRGIMYRRQPIPLVHRGDDAARYDRVATDGMLTVDGAKGQPPTEATSAGLLSDRGSAAVGDQDGHPAEPGRQRPRPFPPGRGACRHADLGWRRGAVLPYAGGRLDDLQTAQMVRVGRIVLRAAMAIAEGIPVTAPL